MEINTVNECINHSYITTDLGKNPQLNLGIISNNKLFPLARYALQ